MIPPAPAWATALADNRLLLPVPIFGALVATYCIAAPYFSTSRSRAYILSSLSSFTLTTASLPFVYAYATGGFQGLWDAGQEGWTKVLADLVVVYFGTYLFSK